MLNVDTEKLVALGLDLKEIAKDLSLLTNDMYSKLMNVSVNGVWVSGSEDGSSNVFVKAVTKDKETMTKYENAVDQLGEKIAFYGKHLASVSNNKL